MTNDKLTMWKQRLEKSRSAYSDALDKMQEQTEQFCGNRNIRPVTSNEKEAKENRETKHVYNITAELIEAEIDSSIPAPKVTPCRKQDERLARMIENMLRAEIDRMPTEEINDIAERMAKIHGACGLLPEWDSTKRNHMNIGANNLETLNPKQIIPQNGPSDLNEMDYYFIRVPMTKTRIQQRYGVDVKDETEDAPELRDGQTADEMATVYMAYYRDKDSGKIGRYVFTSAHELEDNPDCLSRRIKRCKNCGMTMIDSAMTMDEPTYEGERPEGKARRARKDECSYCHGRKWEVSTVDVETVPLSELRNRGVREEVAAQIEAENGGELNIFVNPTGQFGPEPMAMAGVEAMDGAMLTTEMPEVMTVDMPPVEPREVTVDVPYYQLMDYPLVMLRNIMEEDGFMGVSDCDKIKDQQNTINKMEQKIIDKLCKAGRKITMPVDSHLVMDQNDNDIWYVTKMTDLALIKDFNFDGEIEQDLNYLAQVYTEAQRVLGITESFLGRRDATAQSGSAKQFAAQQTAGRLESKRILKKWAWSQVYERLFKNMLANADEPRPMRVQTDTGEVDYEEWNRWEFLEIDEAGELWWNDLFLFSVDDASGLAANREAMWKETNANLQSGAFGNPAEINTLIIYWSMMEELHYPGAGAAKKRLEAERDRQTQMQAMMAQQQAQTGTAQGG